MPVIDTQANEFETCRRGKKKDLTFLHEYKSAATQVLAGTLIP